MGTLARMDFGGIALGTVGEWLGGLGTIAAVGVALWGTQMARRDAEAQRKRAEEAEQKSLDIAREMDQKSLERARAKAIEDAAHRGATSLIVEVIPMDENDPDGAVRSIIVRALDNIEFTNATITVSSHSGEKSYARRRITRTSQHLEPRNILDGYRSDQIAVTVEFLDPYGLRWRRMPNGNLVLLNRREITYEDNPNREAFQFETRLPSAGPKMIVF